MTTLINKLIDISEKHAHNFKDLSGKSYNYWKVLKLFKMLKTKVGKLKPYYECECICGKIKIVRGESISQGKSKSCGCMKIKKLKELRNTHEEFTVAKINSIYGRYRNEALRRNYTFDLTKEQFHKIVKEACYYCGINGANSQHLNDGTLLYYTGIDRVDNDKGYSVENCVPCCKKCNSRKKATSKDMIIKAYNFLKEHGEIEDE